MLNIPKQNYDKSHTRNQQPMSLFYIMKKQTQAYFLKEDQIQNNTVSLWKMRCLLAFDCRVIRLKANRLY